MTLPDKLTISRIFLTFILMFFLFSSGVAAKTLALFTFLLASFTDYLDGLIAKRNGISTDFGKLMDPIADKILILGVFLAFVEMKLVPAWMVVIIVLREITVTGLRFLGATKGVVIASDNSGKQKMVSQVMAIVVILLFLLLREVGIKGLNIWSAATERIYKDAIFFLMLVTVMLTLVSGFSFMVKNRDIYTSAKID
jgi:CDP-diacylglycerol--glycerol-3-phosphate 3-phosphatidyltransferase